jgi:hypothetical protein
MGYLRRGEASKDPALANATVEYGEVILASRSRRIGLRVFLLLLLIAVVASVISDALQGEVGNVLMGVAAAIFPVVLLTRSPDFWPGRVRESVRATRSLSGGVG